jgi:hypothetical protein
VGVAAVDKDQIEDIIRDYLNRCDIDLDVSFCGDRVTVEVKILNPDGGVLMKAKAADNLDLH